MNGIFERYFSFQGRLGRLPYFLRSFQVGIAAPVVFILSTPAFISGNTILWWIGVAVVAVAGAIYLGGIASLIVRRLHDLGLSGYHAIWFAIAVPLNNAAYYGHNTIAILLNLPFVAAGLCVLFWPGQRRPNRYGE